MLTFQDFGTDAGRWREWWNANQDSDWRTLLTRHVQGLLPQLASAKPWVMNEWMNGLVEADDPAVLPFVAAYLRHPRLDIYQTSANGSTVGGGTPGVVRLLLNLASQGSREARELIQECSSTTNFPLAIECSRIVVMLGDRQRGLDRLNALLDQHYRWQVAQALVELGDKRGIAAFIGLLASQDVFTRPLAYNTLRHYTQEDIPDDAVAWQQWWRDAQDTFTVKTAAARMDMDL
jgi:hypothetical protein